MRWPAAQVEANFKHFDLIVTTDDTLVHLPNAQFMIFGDAWTTEAPAQKSFSLSFLWSAGISAQFDGYVMREKLWAACEQLTIPTRYWYSTARPPHTVTASDLPYPAESKDLLFESMFSVIVENVTEKKFFTEKIMDAFQTYTVPLYYGCPNWCVLQ